MADKSFANSEYIFREGESAAYAYVIKSGTVEITKHTADGEQVLAELVAPTIFGEMALIDGNPRSAGARAKENTVVTEVTAESFKTYLSKANDILKENGVFLLHTIGQRGKPTATSPWIRKYIFPGGYIPSLSEVMNATQKLNINVTDVEVLRLHYAHTLSKWYQNVIENKDKIINMFDQRFFRMWEFYLLASKYSFVNMGNVVFQIQIAKNINNLPLTRNYIYN